MSEVVETATADVGTTSSVASELAARFGPDCVLQTSADAIPNCWVPRERLLEVMRYLKYDIALLLGSKRAFA